MLKINNTTFAVIIILFSAFYQTLCAIQGSDLTDEGFLMNAYRWFGEDPSACKDAGGYTLSCLLGWHLMKIYPEGGILVMRLWGVLLVTITEIIAYLFLSRYFNKKLVAIGLLYHTLFLTGDPKPFDYNNLTGFVILMAFITVFYGLSKNRILLLVSGLFVGGAVLLRLPNILFAAIIFTPFFYHWKLSRTAFLECFIMLIGLLVGFWGSWLWVDSYHATYLITDYLQYSGDTLSGESTHKISHMLPKYGDNYLSSIITTLTFGLCILLSSLVVSFKTYWKRLLLLFFIFELLYLQLYIGSNVMGDKIVALFNGIGILGCAYLMVTNKQLRFLTFCAVTISFISPLGSDCGFETSWTGTWTSLPIGLCGVKQICKDIGQLNVFMAVNNGWGHYRIEFRHLVEGFYLTIALVFIPLIVKTDHKPYYDPGNRIDKIYSFDNKYTRHIYTLKSRTDIINPVLKELPKYVKPGDRFLQHDFSPLFYYMMDAKPWTGISWPCVLYGNRFVKEFKDAEKNMTSPPVILLQHFGTSNKWGKVTQDYFNEEECTGFICPDHTKLVNSFINKYNYKMVWTNRYFSIWTSDYKIK